MDKEDLAALLREKPQATQEDIDRLKAGVPLAYVIGNQPFLGLSIGLASHPLIPRPETEWWAQELCAYVKDLDMRVLDVCAGSGAIGLSVLAHCQNARVSFGELDPRHVLQIGETLQANSLDALRADIRAGDLFTPFTGQRFDIIAANPPYIPEPRELDASVVDHEPPEALFAGADGLGVIRRIAIEAPAFLTEGGEVWMECDIDNTQEAAELLKEGGATDTQIRLDPYGRPRLVLAYY